MAQSTAARARGRGRAGTPRRSPELDSTRALALVTATVLLVAPAPLPGWLRGDDLGAATLLPTAFAAIAGVAISHQRAAHAGAGPGWWTARVTRRVVVLVGAGLLLQLLVRLPRPTAALDGLLLTGDLARLGVATGAGLLLSRLSGGLRWLLALGLAGGHAWLVHRGGVPASGGALAGWDAQLLGGWALHPVDPDGLTAVAPTLAVVLVGVAIGDWLRGRPRGAGTVLRLGLAAAAVGAAAHLLADVVAPSAALWSPPVLLGGIAVVLAGLAVGQAATRRATTDRVVATLAVAGRVTLPLWVLAVVTDAWFGASRPVRWLLREVLWPPLGDTGAAVALGLLLGLGLVRVGAALADRGWHLRA